MPERLLPAPHTTPEALELNRILNQALGQGATEAVMEVSSHALEQQRVYGIPFDVAVFTNLTRDHLDYHHTMEEYFSSKQVLFEGCGTEAPRAAVLNSDDEYGQKLVKISKKRSSEVLTYGLAKGDFHAEKVEITPRGTRFDLMTPEGNYSAVFSAHRKSECVQHSGGGRCGLSAELQAGGDRAGNSGAYPRPRPVSNVWTASSPSPWWWTTLTPTTRCET